MIFGLRIEKKVIITETVVQPKGAIRNRNLIRTHLQQRFETQNQR